MIDFLLFVLILGSSPAIWEKNLIKTVFRLRLQLGFKLKGHPIFSHRYITAVNIIHPFQILSF